MSRALATPYTHLPSQADLFYFCTLSGSNESLDLDVPPPSNPSLRLGVLLLGDDEISSLDFACVDMLSSVTRRRLEAMGAPSHVVEQGVDMDIRYISEGGNGSFALTNGAQVSATVS
jgi:hypothetical protein